MGWKSLPQQAVSGRDPQAAFPRCPFLHTRKPCRFRFNSSSGLWDETGALSASETLQPCPGSRAFLRTSVHTCSFQGQMIALIQSKFYSPEVNSNPLLLQYYCYFVPNLTGSAVWNLGAVAIYSTVFSLVYTGIRLVLDPSSYCFLCTRRRNILVNQREENQDSDLYCTSLYLGHHRGWFMSIKGYSLLTCPYKIVHIWFPIEEMNLIPFLSF